MPVSQLFFPPIPLPGSLSSQRDPGLCLTQGTRPVSSPVSHHSLVFSCVCPHLQGSSWWGSPLCGSAVWLFPCCAFFLHHLVRCGCIGTRPGHKPMEKLKGWKPCVGTMAAPTIHKQAYLPRNRNFPRKQFPYLYPGLFL